MRIYPALALALLLTGCTGTGGAVISIDTLESCWEDRSKVQMQLAECNAKPQENCEVEETKISLFQARINELEAQECPVCDECEVCEAASPIIINNTEIINNTVIIVNETCLNITEQTNITNQTGGE